MERRTELQQMENGKPRGNVNGWKAGFFSLLTFSAIVLTYLIVPAGARVDRLEGKLNGTCDRLNENEKQVAILEVRQSNLDRTLVDLKNAVDKLNDRLDKEGRK